MKETEDPTKGSILRGNDNMDQGGGQMQIRKENVDKSVSVCKPIHEREVQQLLAFQEVDNNGLRPDDWTHFLCQFTR